MQNGGDVVNVALADDRTTSRAIARGLLNVPNINKIFIADVEFLQEETAGNALWPDKWVAECLPPPAVYILRERVMPLLAADALECDEYYGGGIIVIDGVPEGLNSTSLLTWLRAGFDDDDPEFSALQAARHDARRSLDLTDDAIKQLALISAKPAGFEDVAERADRILALNARRAVLHAGLIAGDKAWERADAERAAFITTALPELVLIETRYPLRLNVWEARFADTPAAARLAYLASHKANWSQFSLAIDADTARSGHSIASRRNTTRQPVPHGYMDVNMRGVTVSRRRHGSGATRFSDERGYYAGGWVRGVRNGRCVELNALGRFEGTLQHEWRRGPGRQIYANGDVYAGHWGCAVNHTRESLLHGDEYTDGLPEGTGDAAFVDGSTYAGSWEGGMPVGRGRYVGADGVVVDGDFGLFGELHGTGCTTTGDATLVGQWQNGALHGPCGVEVDADLGTYNGAHEFGMRHGYGIHRGGPLRRSEHVGWWLHGLRDGRGELNADDPLSWSHGSADSQTCESLVSAAATIAREAGAAWVDPTAANERRRVCRRRRIIAATAIAGVRHCTHTTHTTENTQVSALVATQPLAQPHGRLRCDVRVEARWRANIAQGGGVLTLRNGADEPTSHDLFILQDRRNNPALGTDAAPVAEAATRTLRSARVNTMYRKMREARLRKEADNARSFAHWTAVAAAAYPAIVQRIRRGRRATELLRTEYAVEANFGYLTSPN